MAPGEPKTREDAVMDEQLAEMVVLDQGKVQEEVAAEMACCKGRPSAASAVDSALA